MQKRFDREMGMLEKHDFWNGQPVADVLKPAEKNAPVEKQRKVDDV
jgi:hypothetical protein